MNVVAVNSILRQAQVQEKLIVGNKETLAGKAIRPCLLTLSDRESLRLSEVIPPDKTEVIL